jgi:nucleoside-diphosphate-sugar epimerase
MVARFFPLSILTAPAKTIGNRGPLGRRLHPRSLVVSMPATWLITGATGFVGSHVAAACKARGLAARTIARPTSDAAFLEGLGVSIVRGDLTDPAVVRQAADGADVVVHCAARVGDWGPVEDYRAVNVEGLRGLLDACVGRPLKRFVHLSTLGVYAARHHHGTDETEPLPESHMDGYTQTKVEAEQLALQYHRQNGVPVVVLRPGFVYGPRDRTVLPKVIDNLRQGKFRFLGSGRQALNTIFVGNLVDAIFLAADKPQAVGQVYNLTDGEFVSKRRFIEALVQGLGLPGPKPISIPLFLARPMAWWMERDARKKGATKAPRLTQARLKFLGLNLDFSIDKAKRELGYQPRVGFDDGMRETVAWYRENG